MGIETLRSKWPVAYADLDSNTYVDLKEHLIKVAQLILALFSDRIDYLKKNYAEQKKCSGDIKEIAYVSGLLHDLGKASAYYLKRYLRQQHLGTSWKVSFPLHEHATSLLILGASFESVDTGLINAYRLVARVIARHHTAIGSRHPNKVRLSEGVNIDDVLNGMCDRAVYDLLRGLSDRCIGSYCSEIVKGVENTLRKHCERGSIGVVRGHYSSVKAFDQVECRDFEYDSYRIVSSLTGFLIVADNLVASYCERRLSDDETAPAFVETWRRELYPKLLSLSRTGGLFEVCSW